MVQYGSHYRYKRNRVREYITGMVESSSGEGQFDALFHNIPIEMNQSYIVTNEGVFLESLPSDLWCDHSSNSWYFFWC